MGRGEHALLALGFPREEDPGLAPARRRKRSPRKDEVQEEDEAGRAPRPGGP